MVRKIPYTRRRKKETKYRRPCVTGDPKMGYYILLSFISGILLPIALIIKD
jgi:hypothetical protein